MELGACSVCGEPAKSKGMCRKHYLVAWRAAHPNYDRTTKAEYWKKNKARRKAIVDRYYEKNKAVILERQAKFYVENKERLGKRNALWKKTNPEQSRRQSSIRRAKLRASSGDHTVTEIRRLLVRQKNACAVCRCDIGKKKHTVDHIVPLARGGSNAIENIQLLCATCNKQKGTKDAVQFMRSKGFLL